MRVKFLHLADIHLGYQQYGLRERFNDFGRAFEGAIDHALEDPVDFVIITGDLFHKAAIDPPTLLQAVNNLDRLRQAGVPVAAIHGNHDQARYRAGISWLDFLAERGYLALLSPTFTEGGLDLQRWNGCAGAYIDIGPVRVLGVPYLGASTRPVIADLPQALEALDNEGIAFTVLMAHVGVEGEMPGLAGGLKQEELAPLRPHVDYVALGHLHKPFEREGWVYNPGALEICGMDERRWVGGFFRVTVNTEGLTTHQARHIKSKRRPFHRVVFPIDDFQTPMELYDAVRARFQDGDWTSQSELAPVVELSLEGVLAFDRGDLDLDHVKSIVDEAVSPLLTRVRNNTRPTEFEIAPDEHLERMDLERAVLHELTLRDARFRGRADAWAGLMAEVKTMALTGSAPEAISAAVRQRLPELASAAETASQKQSD